MLLAGISRRVSVRRFSAAAVAAKTDSSFDVFAKIKDGGEKAETKTDLKRKPSDRVLKLADDIMGLSLVILGTP